MWEVRGDRSGMRTPTLALLTCPTDRARPIELPTALSGSGGVLCAWAGPETGAGSSSKAASVAVPSVLSRGARLLP